MAGVVIATSVEDLQRQYGTLRAAVHCYLDDKMPEQQQAALERVVPAELISAFALNRAMRVIAEAHRIYIG